MVRLTTLEVKCRCEKKLFKYQKMDTGRLIKCFLSKILRDYVNLPPNLKTGDKVLCPSCQKRIGAIQMIHGEPAVKLNQGQIKPIRIG